MEKVRIGIIGLGVMGKAHGDYLAKGEVKNAELTAVSDAFPAALQYARDNYGEGVKTFENADDLIASGEVDAVMVVTPHFSHPEMSMKAFDKGLHVMCEKPTGVCTKNVLELNAAADQTDLMFGAMFCQRTVKTNQKLKELISTGELGPMKRNCWMATTWYRPQSYYDSGVWRATWAGEGGGLLINQCPHTLDLWQWLCGMPTSIRAFCSFGKYHDIEVEDEVTAYATYENGATGVFIASTGEAPGSERFEVAGDMGNLIVENGKVNFLRNRIGERQFSSECKERFAAPEFWKCEIPVQAGEASHCEVTQKWVNAIVANDSSLMLVDGREGIKSLEIGNAMLFSAWTDSEIKLPLDHDAFYDAMQEKIATSRYKK